jgi:hypothetical protein
MRSGTQPAPNRLGNRGVILLGQSGGRVKIAIFLHVLRCVRWRKWCLLRVSVRAYSMWILWILRPRVGYFTNTRNKLKSILEGSCCGTVNVLYWHVAIHAVVWRGGGIPRITCLTCPDCRCPDRYSSVTPLEYKSRMFLPDQYAWPCDSCAQEPFAYYYLWPSGQSSWLQIQRSQVRFSSLLEFLRSSESGTASSQLRMGNWGATWMKK